MRFEGESVINASREKVWKYVSDPRNGLEYVPNIKKLDIISEDKFTATVGVSVAGIKGTFNLNFEIIENICPSHGKLKASGEGIKSVVNFEAQVNLSEVPDGKTVMTWVADANVGGLIAGVGQRLLRMVADKLIKEGFGRMKSKLENCRMHLTPVHTTYCDPDLHRWYQG